MHGFGATRHAQNKTNQINKQINKRIRQKMAPLSPLWWASGTMGTNARDVQYAQIFFQMVSLSVAVFVVAFAALLFRKSEIFVYSVRSYPRPGPNNKGHEKRLTKKKGGTPNKI
nr:hypothetical protein [Pandoravirus massiliensis]